MTLTSFVVAAIALQAGADPSRGVYQGGSRPAEWSVSSSQVLTWDGIPYLPYGLRVAGDLPTIEAGIASGIKDFVVELPVGGDGWAPILDRLNAANARYLLAVGSAAPASPGVLVDPGSYRLHGISGARRISLNLPAATEALCVLVVRRDGAVVRTDRVPVQDGRLVYEAKPVNTLEHSLYVYPTVLAGPDADQWSDLDRQRDTFLASLKRHRLGAGLRGIVSPRGRRPSRPSGDPVTVPSDPQFRIELRNLLEKRYRTVPIAMRSWSMSSAPVSTFEDLAQLIPLWNGTRGVPQFWSAKTGQPFACDMRKSTYWKDLKDAYTEAAARRAGRFTLAIRGVCDVPVLDESLTGTESIRNLSGLGLRASGDSVREIVEATARVSGSLMSWSSPAWFVATDLDPSPEARGSLDAILEDVASLGTRGWFVRASNVEEVNALKGLVSRSADAAQLGARPNAFLFPENAFHPASVQRLPGGAWWLPAPIPGNRLEFGAGFYGYRMEDRGTPEFVMWCRTPRRYKLLLTNPAKASFASVDGSDPKPKQVKGGVEVTMTDLPLRMRGVEEVPVPEAAYREVAALFAYATKQAEAQKVPLYEELNSFTDLNNGFERNPGGNFPALRRLVYRTLQAVGSFSWTEAELGRDTNFGDPLAAPAASNGLVLALRTAFPGSDEGFYSQYSIAPRTRADRTLWVAARVPKEARPLVTVMLDGTPYPLVAPRSFYADGFGWYRVGVSKARAGVINVRVIYTGDAMPEIALDTLVLAPADWNPDGLSMPTPVVPAAK